MASNSNNKPNLKNAEDLAASLLQRGFDNTSVKDDGTVMVSHNSFWQPYVGQSPDSIKSDKGTT